MGKVDGPGNKPQENGCHEIEELTDMSDTEAQCIIGDLGGFAKPKVHIKDSANSMAKHKSFERKPSKDMHQQPQSPSALSTSCVADRMSSDVDESVTQKTSNPFPSKKDVLSARRALRMDGGKTMTISFNTPTKLNGLEQPAQGGSRPQNQLRFKSPSLKRPAVRSQFSSPSKRLFISKDIAYNDSANTTGALRKSPARLLQFSKPFRSPARIANLGSVSLPQNPGSSIEQRPPPQLPPAIRKESIKPDERVLMGTPSCSIKQNSDEAADML
ncbi:hypothetical protein IW138_000893 [Coemansia sp. RSA 986]|nr:hypothetical protein IW138_000893 [Coemansia sp. RSA 986]